MSAIGMSDLRGMISVPSWRDIRVRALDNPWVMALTVLIGGVVALALIAAVVFLAWQGKFTEAIGAFILALLGVTIGRLRQIRDVMVASSTQDKSTVEGER